MFELAQIGESEVVFHPVSALVDQFGLGSARLYRTALPGGEVIVNYHVQVWQPTFEHAEMPRDAGWVPHEGGNEELDNTMCWHTKDWGAALAVAPVTTWDASPIFELEPVGPDDNDGMDYGIPYVDWQGPS